MISAPALVVEFPAAEAGLTVPDSIAVGPDGSLYIVDFWYHRIRKVSPAGIITTVVGTGEPGNTGDGGPAIAARINRPNAVTGGPDGTVDTLDLLALLGDWGNPSITGIGDITGPAGVPDGVTDTLDLLALLGAWGPCP